MLSFDELEEGKAYEASESRKGQHIWVLLVKKFEADGNKGVCKVRYWDGKTFKKDTAVVALFFHGLAKIPGHEVAKSRANPPVAEPKAVVPAPTAKASAPSTDVQSRTEGRTSLKAPAIEKSLEMKALGGGGSKEVKSKEEAILKGELASTSAQPEKLAKEALEDLASKVDNSVFVLPEGKQVLQSAQDEEAQSNFGTAVSEGDDLALLDLLAKDVEVGPVDGDINPINLPETGGGDAPAFPASSPVQDLTASAGFESIEEEQESRKMMELMGPRKTPEVAVSKPSLKAEQEKSEKKAGAPKPAVLKQPTIVSMAKKTASSETVEVPKIHKEAEQVQLAPSSAGMTSPNQVAEPVKNDPAKIKGDAPVPKLEVPAESSPDDKLRGKVQESLTAGDTKEEAEPLAKDQLEGEHLQHASASVTEMYSEQVQVGPSEKQRIGTQGNVPFVPEYPGPSSRRVEHIYTPHPNLIPTRESQTRIPGADQVRFMAAPSSLAGNYQVQQVYGNSGITLAPSAPGIGSDMLTPLTDLFKNAANQDVLGGTRLASLEDSRTVITERFQDGQLAWRQTEETKRAAKTITAQPIITADDFTQLDDQFQTLMELAELQTSYGVVMHANQLKGRTLARSCEVSGRGTGTQGCLGKPFMTLASVMPHHAWSR